MALIGLSLLFLLSFTGCCVGLDILPEGPVDEILGKPLTLKTLHTKKPDDILVWAVSDGNNLKNIATLRPNGFQVNDAYKGRASVNSTTGYLTINSLKPEDSGDYSLTILTDEGTLTGEIKVRVLEPVSGVQIKSNLPEVIEFNSTVVLTCSSKGSYLTFTWTNNSKAIVPGGRVTVNNRDDSSNLTITGVLRSDFVGPIVCTAANKLEKESSAPFNLTVYYGPDDVKIKPSASSEYVPSKSNFNMTCSASSNPAATFTWFHDEKEIKATGPVLTLKTIEEQGLGKTKGSYKCVAQNAKTKRAVASATIQFSVMEPISGVKLTGPTGLTLIAGNSSANLSCQATAGNVTETVWLKDGKALSASPLVVFSSDRSSIFFKMLQKEDNGNYTCQLINSVSKKEDHFKMVVNYGPESAKVEGKLAVELEDLVALTCSVSSVPPANITWRINGTVIPKQTKNVLIIEKAAYKDSGKYTCEASNSVTGKSTTSSHDLSVQAEIEEGLSDGAIAGIVIACLVAVGACIALFFYCRQKLPVDSPY